MWSETLINLSLKLLGTNDPQISWCLKSEVAQ